jgi:hypothetical protein
MGVLSLSLSLSLALLKFPVTLRNRNEICKVDLRKED